MSGRMDERARETDRSIDPGELRVAATLKRWGKMTQSERREAADRAAEAVQESLERAKRATVAGMGAGIDSEPDDDRFKGFARRDSGRRAF